jgi:hypothetical protein
VNPGQGDTAFDGLALEDEPVSGHPVAHAVYSGYSQPMQTGAISPQNQMLVDPLNANNELPDPIVPVLPTGESVDHVTQGAGVKNVRSLRLTLEAGGQPPRDMNFQLGVGFRLVTVHVAYQGLTGGNQYVCEVSGTYQATPTQVQPFSNEVRIF